MTLRVATYCRISDDRQGQALGVKRQAEDCDALARDRGWAVVGRYTDNDLSAYSGKARPAYDQLLDAVRGGNVDVILAWHPDRLHRSPRELEDFLAVVERHAVTVETVRAGRWDLSTASGRAFARSLGNFSRYESELKSERVRRALAQRADSGKAHGRRAYGWTLGGGVQHEEAAVVVEAAERIVRGDSLRSIVADLNTRGVPSPSGKMWAKNMLRAVIIRDRNVGLRVHHGEIIGAGDWPPILDRSLWEQTRAVLNDPARRTSTSSTARHLLSGLARCGVCDATMRASMNRTVPSYRCADRSCVSRNRADLDRLVTDVVLARLARADAAALRRPADDSVRRAVADVAELRGRLDNAADAFADGTLDREQVARITERLRPRLAAAQARARVVDDAPLLDGLVGPGAGDAWADLPLARRRAVVDLLLEVRVLRTSPGARTFNPDVIEMKWRTV